LPDHRLFQFISIGDVEASNGDLQRRLFLFGAMARWEIAPKSVGRDAVTGKRPEASGFH
jgi:hypothetical protein